MKYQPFLRPEDKPPLELNREILDRFHPAMKRYYYDAKKYRVQYPVLPDTAGACAVKSKGVE